MTMTADKDQLASLFEEYEFSHVHREMFEAAKTLRNMPAAFKNLSDEELIWNVGVETAALSLDNDDRPPAPSDLKFCRQKLQERLKRLDAAEEQYKWFSLQWTKEPMKQLIRNWFCGMLVIDPKLTTNQGNPIQFVHEYYGDDSGYPSPENQTDEWKRSAIELYVLMARSTCKAYPMSTRKGIVSLSDMQDFDWDKYDMGTKERNANIGSLIPNKLKRMVTFHPDEKMDEFYNDMTPSARKKFGFEQYKTLEDAIQGEGDFLPSDLPTFMGGNYRVDILECLKYLFRREPEALALMLETHAEMEAAGEIPRPKHME